MTKLTKIISVLFLLLYVSTGWTQLTNVIGKDSSEVTPLAIDEQTDLDAAFFNSLKQNFVEYRDAIMNRGYNDKDYATIAAAVTAASADTALLTISSRHDITSNTTISGQTALFVNPNGRFNVSSGDTLTINVPLQAGLYQIFEGDGEVRFGTNLQGGLTSIVHVEWFGGKPDFSTDNATAFKKTISALQDLAQSSASGGILQLAEGRYLTSETIFVPRNFTIQGLGHFSTQIMVKDDADITVINTDSSSGQNYVTLRDVYIIGKDYTASPTRATVRWSGSFGEISNCQIQGGRFNLMLNGASYLTVRRTTLTDADSSNFYIPDSLNGTGSTGSIEVKLEYSRFLISNGFGALLEGDRGQADGGGGGNRIFFDNCEFSQIAGEAALKSDSAGEVFVTNTDVSASTNMQYGFYFINTWKPRIVGCEAEMGGSGNEIGYYFKNQISALIDRSVASVSITNGKGMKFDASSENRIFQSNMQGDSVGVWFTNSSNGNHLSGVIVANVDATNGVCFLEDGGSEYNRYTNCHAKTLQVATITGYSLSDRSQVVNSTISGDGSDGFLLPVSTGEGRVHPITDGDATPSVANGTYYSTSNTGSTTITALDDPSGFGKRVAIIFGDGNTTIDFSGTNLEGNDGVDWNPRQNDIMECIWDGSNWFCDITPIASGISFNRNSIGIGGAVNATIDLQITDGSPAFVKQETDAPADNQVWKQALQGGSYKFSVQNDAFSVESLWLQVDRTGTTIDSIKSQFGAWAIGNTATNGEGSFTADSLFQDGTKIAAPSFVFEPNYISSMPTIEETYTYMMREKQLPTMGEENKEAVNLGRMNMQLLETIERQQIYISQLNERLKKLENEE